MTLPIALVDYVEHGNSPMLLSAYPASVACDGVAFLPNSDWGAFDVKAIGTDCATAEPLALSAKGQNATSQWTSNGYTCQAIFDDNQADGIPHSAVLCNNDAGARVLFNFTEGGSAGGGTD